MYPRLIVQPKSGQEEFHRSGKSTGVNVLSFWSWSASNLASNNLRGHLAEYIVAKTLEVPVNLRTEWDSCDIRSPLGRIEVKSASYIQSWKQTKLSAISFSIAPALVADDQGRYLTNDSKRHSDVYVFCLLKHQIQETFDPMDLDQWEFYVLPTAILDQKLGKQKTLSLNRLKTLTPIRCDIGELKEAIEKTLGSAKQFI